MPSTARGRNIGVLGSNRHANVSVAVFVSLSCLPPSGREAAFLTASWKAAPKTGHHVQGRHTRVNAVNPVQPPAAVVNTFDTDWNIVFSEPPIAVNAPIAATDTRAAIKPYSMDVAPLSSLATVAGLLNHIAISTLLIRRHALCAAVVQVK